MNARLQVEHPVTEAVTSLDLVKLQIRIAAGEKIPFEQEDVSLRGHAMECRLYAEDPDNNFFPSPGKIVEYRAPSGPGIRMDDGVYTGWAVPNEYDPMLGKLIAWGNDRTEAIERLRRALEEYCASGIKTNISLFRRVLEAKDFQEGKIYTQWLDDFLRKRETVSGAVGEQSEEKAEIASVIAAALWHQSRNGGSGGNRSRPAETPSRWRSEGREEAANRFPRR
jgi:acetyl-CoA carboxylase biotin carboxylase subunit